jgi:hypothetical protein
MEEWLRLQVLAHLRGGRAVQPLLALVMANFGYRIQPSLQVARPVSGFVR